MKRLNIKLDPETHRKLKMAAVTEMTTLQGLVVSLIKQKVYQLANGK